MLGHVIGYGYSPQSIVRLLESGGLIGHRMKPRGRWWVLSGSLAGYIHSILRQDVGMFDGLSDVAQLVNISCDSQRLM